MGQKMFTVQRIKQINSGINKATVLMTKHQQALASMEPRTTVKP